MSSKRWVSALLFAAIAFSSAHTQTKATVKLSPDTPDFSKEAYVIERLSSRIKLENDGTGTREVAAEVKVLADAGVKAFAVLNFTYTSANEVVEIDYVRVRKPDGTVVKTPDYNIQDMPGEVTRTAPLYSDIHEKHVAVKGLGVGDVLEYLARYRIIKPQVAGQFWQEYSFAKDSIDRDERVEIVGQMGVSRRRSQAQWTRRSRPVSAALSSFCNVTIAAARAFTPSWARCARAERTWRTIRGALEMTKFDSSTGALPAFW